MKVLKAVLISVLICFSLFGWFEAFSQTKWEEEDVYLTLPIQEESYHHAYSLCEKYMKNPKTGEVVGKVAVRSGGEEVFLPCRVVLETP